MRMIMVVVLVVVLLVVVVLMVVILVVMVLVVVVVLAVMVLVVVVLVVMVLVVMVMMMMTAGTIWGRGIYIITWRYEWRLNKRQDCLLSKPRFRTIHVFWGEKLCLCASSVQHCHRSQCLCVLELLGSEDESKTLLRNVCMYCRRNDVVPHPRRPGPSTVSQWRPQNSRDDFSCANKEFVF